MGRNQQNEPAAPEENAEDSTDEQTVKKDGAEPGSIDDWFTVQDNQPLIQHARADGLSPVSGE